MRFWRGCAATPAVRSRLATLLIVVAVIVCAAAESTAAAALPPPAAEMTVVPFQGALGRVSDTEIDVSVAPRGAAPARLVIYEPQGWGLGSGAAVGTPLGSILLSVLDDKSPFEPDFADGELTVGDPALGADAAAQACSPGSHDAVWLAAPKIARQGVASRLPATDTDARHLRTRACLAQTPPGREGEPVRRLARRPTRHIHLVRVQGSEDPQRWNLPPQRAAQPDPATEPDRQARDPRLCRRHHRPLYRPRGRTRRLRQRHALATNHTPRRDHRQHSTHTTQAQLAKRRSARTSDRRGTHTRVLRSGGRPTPPNGSHQSAELPAARGGPKIVWQSRIGTLGFVPGGELVDGPLAA